ncbi:hypothetical protein QBC40DRAFT_286576 [Triangularia verruculosa]|uniref:Uncharacterized protein n=1 Tax=Triangularia verruculosa TaxID=2587418 RepID=A0AAN7APZ6_9PEZI|nr:hypothetical protein QBC40DRAFT_286576 [Triangularia verruculosa]
MTKSKTLITLPAELRHEILATVIWTPAATPYNRHSLFLDKTRVRLRDDWDIWVPANSPQPPALPLILTCRILRDDVQYLLNSCSLQHRPYEIDIIFVPKCGLFPTWVCCPLPGQMNLDTLQVSFRIMDVQDMDLEDEDSDTEDEGEYDMDDLALVGKGSGFMSRYGGVSSDFDPISYPNPPSGSWNFYRLLASFLALGPRGLTSPTYQKDNRGSLSASRYSLRHLTISVTSKEKTKMDDARRSRGCGIMRPMIDSNPDLPYGAWGENEIFPGPPHNSPYSWTGRTDVDTVIGMHLSTGRHTLGDADRYGLYLANTLWTLLDFSWLSRGYGLMLYESILDDITFYVDGEPRPRFGMDDLFSLEPPKHRTLTPEVVTALQSWKEWVVKWRSRLREGVVLDEPRPVVSFVRSVPDSGYRSDDVPDSDSESGSDM